jgi:hypothetical protein
MMQVTIVAETVFSNGQAGLDFWKGTFMRRFLFTILSVYLLSTVIFAQTSGSPGGLVVFETFGFGVGTDAMKASVLPGVMTTRTVLFATASARLSRSIGLAIVNPVQ